MQDLRARLRAAAAGLPRGGGGSSVGGGGARPRGPPPARLAALSARCTLLLAGDASLHALNTGAGSGVGGAHGAPLALSAPLPDGAHTLVPARGGGRHVAVIAGRGVAVVAVDVAERRAEVRRVGATMFEERPGLGVVAVAWHPRAEDYLMVLTSDGSLRLYDVAGGGDVDGERMRLRVVTTGDAPIAFAFGKGGGWDGLAVYVLTEGGAVYVASPVAPVGTRVSREQWCAMRAEAEGALAQEGYDAAPRSATRTESNVVVEDSSVPVEASDGIPKRTFTRAEPANALTTTTTSSRTVARTPRRQLEFGDLDDDADDDEAVDDDDDGESVDSASRRSRRSRAAPVAASRGASSAMSRLIAPVPSAPENAPWTVRQARLQLRFVERAFEQTDAGDMLMMREFKPAPLLFQGPLFVEKDDFADLSACEVAFTSLTVLDNGPAVPPILLRCTASGQVSVLVGLESVEGQWFLSEDRFGTTGDTVLAANEEYARSASIVAPALLCLEHIEFPPGSAVSLHPVRGKTDFDVLFARAGSAVYSVRLTFLAAIRDPSLLRGTPSSIIVPLLSTAKLGRDSNDGTSDLIGLAPLFQKDLGPLTIALTSDYSLEATAPLRWIADASEDGLPESLVAGLGGLGVGGSGTMPVDGPMTALTGATQPGSNSDLDERTSKGRKNRRGVELDVTDALAAVRSRRDVKTWALGAGSVGSVREATSITDVLEFVENRVVAYTGGDNGTLGVCDLLKSLGVLVPKWADDVSRRARGANQGIALVKGESVARATEADALQVKLRRAVELNENLRARIDTLRQIHESRRSALSPAEVARHAKLKERRRFVAAMQRKIGEVSAAVRAASAKTEAASGRRYSASGSGMDNAIGSLSASPLTRRRASTSVYGSGGRMGRGAGSGGQGNGFGELTAAQLHRIKETLAQQSASILVATERAQALWEKFASV